VDTVASTLLYHTKFGNNRSKYLAQERQFMTTPNFVLVS